MFGLCAYATYGLTNLATLTSRPISASLLDMASVSAVSAEAACAGKVA